MSDKWRRPVRYTLSLCILDVCVLFWSASPHLPPTWTCLGSPAERWAMWQTHAGLSQKLVTAQTFLPLALPSPLAFNTLHFPSGPPLPPSLSRARLWPGLGAKAQAVPSRDHMESAVIWSRVPEYCSSSPSLVSFNQPPPQQTSIPLCLQAAQQADDNIVITTNAQASGRFAVFLSLSSLQTLRVCAGARFRTCEPCALLAGAKGEFGWRGGQRVCCGAFLRVSQGKLAQRNISAHFRN